MPIISIHLVEGRTDEQKEQLIHEVTEACHRALAVPRDAVRIILSDMASQHYGVGGQSRLKSESQ